MRWVFVLVLVFARLAAADEGVPWANGVSEEKQRAALAEFVLGNEAFAQARYTVALEAYERALASWDNPQIQYNAAVCLIQLDRFLEAWARLERSLAYGAQPFDGNLHEQALRERKLLRGQLAELTVTVVESDATVTVDGTPIRANEPTMFIAGKHQLVVSKQGFATDSRAIDLAGNSTNRIEIDLEVPASPVVTRRWSRWVPWTVTGAGVAVAAAGGVFHALSVRNFRRFDDELPRVCPRGCGDDKIPDSVARYRRSGEIDRAIAITAYATGGLAIITGAVLFVMNRERVVESHVGVTSIADGYGLVVGASF